MKNKSLPWLALSLLFVAASPALGQADIRGGWISDINGTRHVYVFKVVGNMVTGTYCTRCDLYENVSIIRDGRITGDKLNFTVLSQNGSKWTQRRVEGSIGNGYIVLAGAGSGLSEQRLVRADHPPAAPPPAPPPAYVPPAPPEQLTLEALTGKWIAGSGPRAQIFILKILDGKLVGLVCGPCDNPYRIAPIEDGAVTGDRLTFYTVHEDWGNVFTEIGPFRNRVTATVARNQMRLHGNIDGIPEMNNFDMTLLGPIRTTGHQPGAASR